MWVMTSDSFVSIVAHRDKPGVMLVRGRFPGDVSRFLEVPASCEIETPTADYRYRMEATVPAVAHALGRAAASVKYRNFKGSIREGFRAIAASETWEAWYHAQHEYHRPRIEDSLGVEGCYGGTD